MPINSRDVAKYFLTKTDEDAGDSISNLKLQKLLYYAQGFCLALHNQPLFDEPIFAWRHGPAIRRIYADYADYGSGPIPIPSGFDPTKLDPEVSDLLDEVYTVYGQFSAWRLREMTHSEPPWRDTWRDDGIERQIPRSAMTAYFGTLVER
jgi:uncharacterized phage-associated protein